MKSLAELTEIFVSQTDGHIDTGVFMSRLADIISRIGPRYDVWFTVFVCTREFGLTLKYKKDFQWDDVLEFLFEKCGEQGCEIEKVEIDGLFGGYRTYDIYIVER